MKRISPLVFDLSIGRQKPESIINKSTACPFCDRENLENIIEEDGPLILLMNKYPTLKETYQTVLIETDQCDQEFSTYPKEHLHKLIQFAIKHWMQMTDSGEFKSVLLFKNHGPLSGGTIHHSHMQIVGLENVDYKLSVINEHFEGELIQQSKSVAFNVSTQPRMGFFEFNIILDDMDDVNILANYIQTAAHFIMYHFNKRCNSYNIFFYNLEDKIQVKVIPRFATSPLFIGYSLPQVAGNINEVAKKINDLYFNR